MTNLKCNKNLFLLIHQLQVEAFKKHGLELTMEQALELFLISKLSKHEKAPQNLQDETAVNN